MGRPAGRNPTAFPHLAGGQRPPIVTPGLSPAPSMASVWRMPSFQLPPKPPQVASYRGPNTSQKLVDPKEI